jgi:asparagine synthase (glutamine-hydrolysing)
MCGFIGSISLKKSYESELLSANKNIICRGPDNLKTYNNNSEIFINLIFNRLAIVDLSEDANQPMISDKGTILMFNGEIYNHRELRKNLENKNINFKTSHSDSEVIHKGLDEYGLEFLQHLRGQFAIFYIDTNKRKSYLIRDRLGQKPMYYKINKNEFFFSSNLKSLLGLTKDKNLDPNFINEYLNLGMVRSPNTIFKNFKKLKPGEVLIVDYSNDQIDVNSHIYWKIVEFLNDKQFIKEEFFEIFDYSIKIRSEADVETANFLSGGLDSTSIIKSLRNQTDNQINTFSVAFDNKSYDESNWSRQVADLYNTNHIEIQINKDLVSESLIESIHSIDEPYADPSVVPSYILSKLISERFKVAISGDGGDELLGGYRRVVKSLNFNKLLTKYSYFYNFYPASFGSGNIFLSKSKSIDVRYRSFLEDQKLLELLKIEESNKYNLDLYPLQDNNYKSLLMSEYLFYLSEMMMFKIDRTSMANSLEIRSPFVDHKLVEYVVSHSIDYINLKKPKKILRDYLSEDFDDRFVTRKKQGFVFDTKEWVYLNRQLILNSIENGTVVNSINPEAIYKLFSIKSRQNSLRIWKLFILEMYLDSI